MVSFSDIDWSWPILILEIRYQIYTNLWQTMFSPVKNTWKECHFLCYFSGFCSSTSNFTYLDNVYWVAGSRLFVVRHIEASAEAIQIIKSCIRFYCNNNSLHIAMSSYYMDRLMRSFGDWSRFFFQMEIRVSLFISHSTRKLLASDFYFLRSSCSFWQVIFKVCFRPCMLLLWQYYL